MTSQLKILALSPILPWVLAFALTAMVVPQRGGANTYARLATLRAITEEGRIRIDDYKDWSVDWALSPSDGHYYSNKAPGSALLGLPFFALTDLIFLHTASAPHRPPGNLTYLVLLFFVQLLPFSILLIALARKLEMSGAPASALHFFALAALFGNTAAIYMGCYSGHGLAAWLFLAAFASWRSRQTYRTGLVLAAAALTDYATIMTLPFVLAAMLGRQWRLRDFAEAAVGSLPIAILWIWYHQSAFGSPFAMASAYANPDNLDLAVTSARASVGGIVSLLPFPELVFKILFGSERGIFFTQAWILVLALFFPWKKWRWEGLFLLGGLLGLIWLNASVGSWAAGRSAGPRYSCLIFPACAYLAALTWSDISPRGRFLLVIGLMQALLYRIMIYPFGERAPVENLWLYYWGRYAETFRAGPLGPVLFKLLAIVMALVMAGFWIFRRRVTVFGGKVARQ